MNKKKILITGATGFIGKEVVKELIKNKYQLLCLSRKKNKNYKFVTWLRSSLLLNKNNLSKIIKFKPYALVHLSWEKIPDFSKKICEKNYKDNIAFLKKIKKLKTIKKIIITGSCFEYKNKYGRKVEKDKVNDIDEFPKAKLKIFNFLKKNFKSQYNYAWFRVFYAYGPNQRKGSLIPYLLNSLKNKNTVEVRNPNLSNDFIYTGDIAKIINKSMELNFKSGIYNLGSGKPKAIKGIINAIEKFSKKKLKVIFGLNKDKKIFYANMDKTNKTFKNRKYTSLKQGIKNILFKI